MLVVRSLSAVVLAGALCACSGSGGADVWTVDAAVANDSGAAPETGSLAFRADVAAQAEIGSPKMVGSGVDAGGVAPPVGAHGGTDAEPDVNGPPGTSGGVDAAGADVVSTAPRGIGTCLNASGGCTEYLPGNEAVISSAQTACMTAGGTWRASCPGQTVKGCKFPPGSGIPPVPGGYILWTYGSISGGISDQCVQSVNVKADAAGPAAPPAGLTCTPSLKLAGSCTIASQNKPFICTAYYAVDVTTITLSCAVGTFSTSACASAGATGHCISAYASTTTEYINYFYQNDLGLDCKAGNGLWCP